MQQTLFSFLCLPPLNPSHHRTFLPNSPVAFAYRETTRAETSTARPGPRIRTPLRMVIGFVNWSDFLSVRRNPLRVGANSCGASSIPASTTSQCFLKQYQSKAEVIEREGFVFADVR